jgi:hypothetical protein
MELLNSAILLLVGAVLAFLGNWFWKHRERVVKKEDEQGTASRQESRELAQKLEQLTLATAKELELDRQERSARLQEQHEELVQRIDLFEKTIIEQLAVLATKISPLWAAVQEKIARDLTHPSPQFQEMDQLLHELNTLDITDEGRERLATLLDERIISTDPEVSEAERKSARLMKGVMAKVIDEAREG